MLLHLTEVSVKSYTESLLTITFYFQLRKDQKQQNEIAIVPIKS